MKTMTRAEGKAGLPAHEQVYRRLRDMVLFGELAPGQPVTIQGLVEALDVGMTPVREALRRLTAEGALDAQGNRRITVPELSTEAVSEISGLRRLLEGALASMAAQHVTEADIAELCRIDSLVDEAIAQGDIAAYLRQNHAFHAQIYAIARAPIYTELVERLWLRFGPSLRVVCGQVGTQNLPDRHKELIEALRQRDADAASVAMSEDVDQGLTNVMKFTAERAQRFD